LINVVLHTRSALPFGGNTHTIAAYL